MADSLLPAIEVTFVQINGHTIDDESTEDGKKWHDAFILGATSIPGARRACWGTSSDPKFDLATHFIDYETGRQQYIHKTNDFKGIVSPPLMHELISPKTTDSYIITPTTPDRSALYAPEVHIVTFWGIDDTNWTELAPEWFTAIAKSDGCLSYIWGEVQPNPLSDISGNAKLGKSGIMISGWKSKDDHDHNVAQPRVINAYNALKAVVKKTETWGMNVTVVEDSGYIHKWKRVAQNKKPLKPTSPALHYALI